MLLSVPFDIPGFEHFLAFWHCKMFQAYLVFSLPQPWNQPFLQWSPVPFGGEWNVEARPGTRCAHCCWCATVCGSPRQRDRVETSVFVFIAYLLLCIVRWCTEVITRPVSSVPLFRFVTYSPAVRTWLLCPHWFICWLEYTEGSFWTANP